MVAKLHSDGTGPAIAHTLISMKKLLKNSSIALTKGSFVILLLLGVDLSTDSFVMPEKFSDLDMLVLAQTERVLIYLTGAPHAGFSKVSLSVCVG